MDSQQTVIHPTKSDSWEVIDSAELRLLRKDAERYLWLRNIDPINWHGKCLRVTRAENIKLGCDAPTADRLDAIIDIAKAEAL